jgi:hypothetical protein
MEWKHPGLPTKKKFKTQSSAGKVMLTVFLGLKRAYTGDYLEKGCSYEGKAVVHFQNSKKMFRCYLRKQQLKYCKKQS